MSPLYGSSQGRSPADEHLLEGQLTLIGQNNGSRLQVTLMYTFDVLPGGEIRPGGHDAVTTRCHY
jgi:hypothetical protein